MARISQSNTPFPWRKAAPLMALAAVSGILAVVFTFAAGTPVAFEPETGTLASGATVTSVSGQSGSGAVKFAAAATPTPTPTPTPTGTPVSGTCPAFPAFPNSSCTGVPASYSLATVASLSSTANGQTIDGKLITGDLTISHNNVTVTNTRIKGVIQAGDHTGLTLKNVDIGPDSCPASANGNSFAVNSDGFNIIQSHIHNIPNDLLRIGGGSPYTLRDSIVDGGCFYSGDHLDAIQWYNPGGVGTISIIHSVIDVRPVNNTGDKGNAALFWADGAGAGTTLTMYNNKLAGGGYTTAFLDTPTGSRVILDVHDNVYVKNSYQFGPCNSNSAAFDGTSGLKFVGNKFDDGTNVGC